MAIFDYRGGGRSSARETAARVAAGAVAKKLLAHFEIEICAFVAEIGGIAIAEPDLISLAKLRKKISANAIFCPDRKAAEKMMKKIEKAKKEGDSLGGILQAAASQPTRRTRRSRLWQTGGQSRLCDAFSSCNKGL